MCTCTDLVAWRWKQRRGVVLCAVVCCGVLWCGVLWCAVVCCVAWLVLPFVRAFTTLTFGDQRGNHFVSTAFETIEKTQRQRRLVVHMRSEIHHELS